MVGVVKPFDIKLHKENDKKAKDFCKTLFSNNYPELEIKEGDTYDADLKVFYNGELRGYIECAMINSWVRTDTAYPDRVFRIPGRKERLLKIHWAYPIYFVSISSDLKGYIACWGESLKPEFLKPYKNCYSVEGEKVYEIPLNLCEIGEI